MQIKSWKQKRVLPPLEVKLFLSTTKVAQKRIGTEKQVFDVWTFGETKFGDIDLGQKWRVHLKNGNYAHGGNFFYCHKQNL